MTHLVEVTVWCWNDTVLLPEGFVSTGNETAPHAVIILYFSAEDFDRVSSQHYTFVGWERRVTCRWVTKIDHRRRDSGSVSFRVFFI